MKESVLKLKRPGDNVFNIRNLLPIPFFLIMVVVAIDLAFQYLGGSGLPAWKMGVGVLLMVYVGVRAWYGVRQAVDFSK